MSENENFLTRFLRFNTLLRRYENWQQRTHGSQSSLHRGQGRVLAVLKMKPETTQRELVYVLNMSPQAVSECLAKLEKAGYVHRSASATDRRVMTIKLTAAGQKAAERNAESSSDSAFDVLTDEEQQTFDGLLTKVENKILDELPEDDFARRTTPFNEMPGCGGGRPGCGRGMGPMGRRFNRMDGYGPSRFPNDWPM
ncbi:MarR family winged helix-turn-helix transcriptional regulator [Lactiplantibacillus modestisalitolerans]|uniref:MarR family winged helix-turn-helix transcriptional regulator n=1 Tax=Lactiplantibacillus modestisalitolerans TaxID=1457219 RepID=A0ABV5WQE2_9LACO|nr:MarR family winged helix-turn-helix transcriptional regulator [Lactiplantibacillus modestisalitolerans]